MEKKTNESMVLEETAILIFMYLHKNVPTEYFLH